MWNVGEWQSSEWLMKLSSPRGRSWRRLWDRRRLGVRLTPTWIKGVAAQWGPRRSTLLGRTTEVSSFMPHQYNHLDGDQNPKAPLSCELFRQCSDTFGPYTPSFSSAVTQHRFGLPLNFAGIINLGDPEWKLWVQVCLIHSCPGNSKHMESWTRASLESIYFTGTTQRSNSSHHCANVEDRIIQVPHEIRPEGPHLSPELMLK